MMAKSKQSRKPYVKKPIKNTLALFDGREPPKQSDAVTLKLIYRQIFERVRRGQADEKDLWAMAAMLEDIHIAVEYAENLDNKEATYAQLRTAYGHIKHAVDHGCRALSGEGLTMLTDALAWHEGLVDNTTEYMIKQIVKVCQYRAEAGEFRVAQVERAQEAALNVTLERLNRE